MRVCVQWFALLTVLALVGTAQPGIVDLDLQTRLTATPPGQSVSVLVFLRDQVDIDTLSGALNAQRVALPARHEAVVRALRATADASQGPLVAHLAQLRAGGQLNRFDALWIANVIRVDATAAMIEEIAQRPDVETVYYNYPVGLINPISIRPAAAGSRAVEPGVVAVRAPEVWALGFTGEGVLVATLDTGVDGNHAALAGRWMGTDPYYAGHPEWAWCDPPGGEPFPYDTWGHGTHTMGTVCGGAPGDQVGVAPGARWIAAAPIDRGGTNPESIADIMSCFQWLIDPDGDPATSSDVPDVCSNSWGLVNFHGMQPCDPRFWSHIDACEAAGIVVLFSAGNEGPWGNTLRRPADRATDVYHSTAIAAIDPHDPNWPIAGFSSRGPTYCTLDGSAAIKPDLAAPGVDIRSSVPGGGYAEMGGTSMASPHVNGVVALMRQACPNLSVDDIKQILIDTSHDLGTPGKDNDYGWGMIDAYDAVMLAQSLCAASPPRTRPDRFVTDVTVPVTITLRATDDGLPTPPAGLSFVVVSLPTHGQLSDPNAGPILAVPYALAAGADQLTYEPSAYYRGEDRFDFRANDGGTPPEGGDSDLGRIRIQVGSPHLAHSFPLDTNPGWTTQGAWAWGVPTGAAGENGCPDPASGFTGANVYGYRLTGDYPNGVMIARTLTTAAIDCTNLTQVSLRFRRWLGVERHSADEASLQVSNDGTQWHTFWQNPDVHLADFGWTLETYDIHAYADNQPTVYIRWALGPTNNTLRFCGWNIDDVEILGFDPIVAAPGDLNCDGAIDVNDVGAFVLVLTGTRPDFPEYRAVYPDCDPLLADCRPDGVIDNFDINPFVALLTR